MIEVFAGGPQPRAAAALATLLFALGACTEAAPPPAREPMRVKIEKVALSDYLQGVSLTGEIKARTQADLSFRVGGKIVSRSVDVGDHVTRDQVIARLDPQDQQAAIDTARAALASAEADLAQAKASFDRQQSLMGQQLTTRRDYDQAEANFRAATASHDAANARLANAQEQLAFTELRATTDGVVTARDVEAGQVVAQGQRIVTVAADGDRDAVFQVDEQILVKDPTGATIIVRLLADPRVVATGTVREVAPAVDPQTGTVMVKIGLKETPPAMTLGAAVSGASQVASGPMVTLPSNALYEADGQPAVWIVDQANKTVSLRAVAIERYDSGRIVVASGLKDDEWVVTAGNQLLSPGQTVTIVEDVATAPAPGARP